MFWGFSGGSGLIFPLSSYRISQTALLSVAISDQRPPAGWQCHSVRWLGRPSAPKFPVLTRRKANMWQECCRTHSPWAAAIADITCIPAETELDLRVDTTHQSEIVCEGPLSNDTYLGRQSTLRVPVMSLWPLIYAPKLSPTKTQKCLVTKEHACWILHQVQPGTRVTSKLRGIHGCCHSSSAKLCPRTQA